jgi:O-antigen/teichoic acid export membrane protein
MSLVTCVPRSFLRREASLPRPAWLSWGSKGLLTLTDQGLIGGSNFLIAVLLARQLPRARYGAYALAFEVFLVLSMTYSCLILEPMLVFGPSTYHRDFRRYFGVLLWIHFGAAFATALLLGGSACLLRALGTAPDLPPVLIAAAFATPSVLLFWLARRAFYVTLDPKVAVVGSLVYGFVLLIGLTRAYISSSLQPADAFLLMAAGALAASSFLLWRLRPPLSLRAARVMFREVISQHWIYGRWAILAALASWISGNIYYILLGAARGLAETGSLKALLNFASPIGTAFAAVSMLVLPYAARAIQREGTAGVERLTWRLSLLYAAGAAGYWAIFLSLEHTWIRALYGGNYSHLLYLVPWIAIGSIVRIASIVQMLSLKALQLPFRGFLAFVFSDVAALLLGLPAVKLFGLQGAIAAYLFSGLIGLFSGFLLLRNVTHHGHPILMPEAAIEREHASPGTI